MLLGLLSYILISLYVFFAPYYLLTKKYSQSYSFADRLLGAFVLGISQIIITEVSLGFALKLTSFNLLLLNIAVSTCILIFAGISRKELIKQFRELKRSLASFLNLVSGHKILLIIFVLAVVQVCWWAFQAYLFPPYAFDALMYDLPKVAHILQSGGIEEFQAGSIYVNTYPFNIELLFLWNVIYLGNDILVNGTQIVFALFAVLAIYQTARRVGVKPEHALFAMIFLFIPIVVQQATTCLIDLATCSLFLIAVNFILLKDRPKINMLMLGLLIGIMLGAKYSLALPSPVIFLAVLFLVLQEIRTEKRTANAQSISARKKVLQDFFLFITPIVAIGGIWYIRNYILFGNPMAPIEVNLMGNTLFPGSVTPADISHDTPVLTDPYTIVNAWMERSAPNWDRQYYTCTGGRGGFGPMFAILLLPSIFFALIIAFKRRLRGYLITSVVFILAFLATPMNWYSQYTIFICGFGIISFTVIMEHLPNSKTIALVAIPVILFTLVVGNYHAHYSPARMWDFIHRPLVERQSSDFPRFGEYGELFEKISEKPGITILYTDVPNNFSYPLWDSNFTNTVINIPKRYTNYQEFIDHVKGFERGLILTTADSDITKYYNADRSKFQLVYQKESWRIFSYTGDESVQKE